MSHACASYFLMPWRSLQDLADPAGLKVFLVSKGSLANYGILYWRALDFRNAGNAGASFVNICEY